MNTLSNLALCTMLVCSNGIASAQDSGCDSLKRTYSDKVEYVQYKEIITGHWARRDTREWDVDGTDLGIPVYSQKENSLWFFFGDTFAKPIPGQKVDYPENWRGTVVGKLTDFNVADGFEFSTFVLDDKGKALGLIDGHHSKSSEYFEVTKICQGAIEVDGVMYAFYESIRHWGEAGYWDVNYSGVIKSADGGKTWERVYDLSWPETDKGQYADMIHSLAMEDMSMKPSGVNIDFKGRTSPAFGQMYPIDGKDGYIYVYGRHAGRQNGIVVGRVQKKEIEHFDKYEYFCGFDKNGKATWLQGCKGLNFICKNEDKCRIAEPEVSNMTVAYNNFLGKWLLVYFKPGTGIVYHEGETPYGPYDKYEVMLSCSDYPFPFLKKDSNNHFYGGFVHELLSKNNGEYIYLVISQWNHQFYGSELYEVKFKNPCK